MAIGGRLLDVLQKRIPDGVVVSLQARHFPKAQIPRALLEPLSLRGQQPVLLQLSQLDVALRKVGLDLMGKALEEIYGAAQVHQHRLGSGTVP